MKKLLFYRYFFFSFAVYNLVKAILLVVYHKATHDNIFFSIAIAGVMSFMFLKNESDIKK